MTNQDRLTTVVKSVVVSEKANLAQQQSKLVLIVDKHANKHEIKQAVKLIFGLEATAINTVIVKGKAKSRGNRKGVRKDVKKAYVSLDKNAEAIAE